MGREGQGLSKALCSLGELRLNGLPWFTMVYLGIPWFTYPLRSFEINMSCFPACTGHQHASQSAVPRTGSKSGPAASTSSPSESLSSCKGS